MRSAWIGTFVDRGSPGIAAAPHGRFLALTRLWPGLAFFLVPTALPVWSRVKSLYKSKKLVRRMCDNSSTQRTRCSIR